MALSKKIVAAKTIDGGVEGAIAGALTILAVGLLKKTLELDASTEAQLSVAVGAVVTGAVIGISRGVRNWLKHRKSA
jgi:hypothetical protein